MKYSTLPWSRLLVFSGLLLGLAPWIGYQGLRQGKRQAPHTVLPKTQDIVVRRMITGSIMPKQLVGLVPPIDGLVEALYVAVGDYVKKGQPIALIKPSPQPKCLIDAQLALQKATHHYQKTKAIHFRQRALFKDKLIAPSAYEAAAQAWKDAQSSLQHAKNHYSIVTRGSLANTARAGAIVWATESGTVLTLPHQVGGIVLATTAARVGSTIATLGNMNKMIFKGMIGEEDIDALHRGMTFSLTLKALPQVPFVTTVTHIAPQGKEEKGGIKFELEGQVVIPEALRHKIRSGYTGTGSLELKRKNQVLTIPEQLIQLDVLSNRSFVWVLKDGKPHQQYVTLGISNGIDTEVVAGITPDTLLVTNPHD